jgi:hypothetical protein
MINDVDDIKLASDCVKMVCLWRFLYIKDTTYGEKEFMRKFFAHISTTFAAGDRRDPNLESGVEYFEDSRASNSSISHIRTENVFIAAHSTAT